MKQPCSIDDILSKLTGACKRGDIWVANCPAPGHRTPEEHLTLKDAGDKALVTCQGGRHSYRDICGALGYDSLGYTDNGRGDITFGRGCYRVTDSLKRGDLATDSPQNPVTPPALPDVTGVTVSGLAEAKKLPVEFLKSLGISDFKYRGQPTLRIPYSTEDGDEAAIRFRLALTGDSRFRWRKGDHPIPYGLNRLQQIRKAAWVLIVEGESDCWTGWFHGIPTLGIPGKGVWRTEWGGYLDGLSVYLWQEPEAEDFVLRVLKSVPDLMFIKAPEGMKDISEAHIQGYDILALLNELKVKAKPGQILKEHKDSEQLDKAYQEAKAVIEAEDPLEVIKGAILGLGYGGDLKPAIITYLAATSRLLAMRDGAMPVHLLLSGPSSSGKNHTLSMTKKLLPYEAQHIIDAGSPRTIIYDDADLEHKLLVFWEADSLPAGEDNPAASAIRNLLQDQHLHYEVTVRDKVTGDYKVKKVSKPGPTVLITTSTNPLGHQLMTRLFTLELGDSKEQISAALNVQAELETEGPRSLNSGLIAFQAYLQLKVPWRVRVPFARELAAALGKSASAPRVLRDFARLLSMIKAVTIIRHNKRRVDDGGYLIALPEDYETVRELVSEMYVYSVSGAATTIQQLVEAVRALDAATTEGSRVTGTMLADYLNITKMAAHRRAKKALKEGWLINRELRKGYPADFAIGEPMPDVEGLPVLSDLTCNKVTDGNTPYVTDSSLENRLGNAVTPSTAGDTTLPSVGSNQSVKGKDPWDEFLEEVESKQSG